MKVLIVGLNPAKCGGSAPSLKNLYKWLDTLELERVSFINLFGDYGNKYEISNAEFIESIAPDYDKVITLGTVVHKYLVAMQISHYSLPHPSPLNRKLNDPIYVHETLEACKNYLSGR